MGQSLNEWIEGSYFVDDDGMPVTLYHGTETDVPFNVFACCEEASLGFHFGTVEAANDRLSQIQDDDVPAGCIIPVYCNATSPLIMRDLFTWGQLEVVSALLNEVVLSADDAEFVMAFASAEMIYAVIEEAGYDCVVYANACEDRHSGTRSLMVWRAAQIKGVHTSLYDRDDPRILAQSHTSEQDLDWYGFTERSINDCRGVLRHFRSCDESSPSGPAF